MFRMPCHFRCSFLFRSIVKYRNQSSEVISNSVCSCTNYSRRREMLRQLYGNHVLIKRSVYKSGRSIFVAWPSTSTTHERWAHVRQIVSADRRTTIDTITSALHYCTYSQHSRKHSEKNYGNFLMLVVRNLLLYFLFDTGVSLVVNVITEQITVFLHNRDLIPGFF